MKQNIYFIYIGLWHIKNTKAFARYSNELINLLANILKSTKQDKSVTY